jgi:hypothetical protein
MNTDPGMTRGECPADALPWKELVAPYQTPAVGRSVWQMVNTLVPYAVLTNQTAGGLNLKPNPKKEGQ